MAAVKTVEELRAIYGEPFERSVTKEIKFLNAQYQEFVKASPFVILASSGTDGVDCSPKGDAPGFVRIIDERTLAIPDRPGVLGVIATRLGTLGVNILEVDHRRLFLDVPAKGAKLDITVETRDRAHAEEIMRALDADGYAPVRIETQAAIE